jgi:hypothetical protein
MKNFCTYAVLLLTMLANSAYAGSDLTCTITGVTELTTNGELESLAGKKNYYETAIGAQFIVQRDQGLMAGRFVSNAGWKVTVIDQGSAQQSYKVISNKLNGRVQAQFLEVRLQEKSDKKPFFLLAAEIIYGYCVL